MQAWKYERHHSNSNNNNRPSMDDSILHTHANSARTSPLSSPLSGPQLIKSNSYSGTVADSVLESTYKSGSKSHCGVIGSTIVMDQETNFNAIEANKINAAAAAGSASAVNVNEDSNEYDTFLINTTTITTTTNGSASGAVGSTRRSTRSYSPSSKLRNSCWMRTHAFITRNWYLSYLLPISILAALLVVAYLTRDYAKQLLFWIEMQSAWLIFIIFMALFILVSFPIVVGYFVLLITAGYLFGCWKGWFTVILGANIGIAVAHLVIRSCRHRIPVQKLIKNETGRAILRVISGPKAFRVVLFTRLTPIPFGLQNVIFGISSINARDYHVATFLGLLPAQTINVYLGSTLRSMHEVLNDHDTKLTGYISFVFEVICGVGLMFWVVQKARKELSETLLTDYGNDGKHLDMQV
ncbi:transmembrane protein 64 isoform X2 [Scaptodrosophila lebanonensis]|nr:transmembrane protein 64 isoform X2 [Scaptodrosophila lebanonensis]